MDKKGLTGLLLIAGILMVWQYLNQPSIEEQEALKRQQDSVAAAQIVPV